MNTPVDNALIDKDNSLFYRLNRSHDILKLSHSKPSYIESIKITRLHLTNRAGMRVKNQ